jgi:hypothetical protein
MNEYVPEFITVAIMVSFVIAYLSIKYNWKMSEWF